MAAYHQPPVIPYFRFQLLWNHHVYGREDDQPNLSVDATNTIVSKQYLVVKVFLSTVILAPIGRRVSVLHYSYHARTPLV